MAEKIQAILKNPETLNKVSDGMFDKADLNGSGFVEKIEFKHMLDEFTITCGIPMMNDQQIDQIIKTLDYNGDGKFSKCEFRNFIKFFFESLIQMILNCQKK